MRCNISFCTVALNKAPNSLRTWTAERYLTSVQQNKMIVFSHFYTPLFFIR